MVVISQDVLDIDVNFDETAEFMQEVEEVLEQEGYSILEYNINFYADVNAFGTTPEEALEETQDELEGGAFHIKVEEPVTDYRRPHFGTQIWYETSSDEEDYFHVEMDPDHSQVSPVEADRWKAGIEKALHDAGYTVRF